MRNAMKTLLFVSAFSPVLLSVAIVKFINNSDSLEYLYFSLAGLVGFSLTFVILREITTRGEVIAFSAKKVESNDALLLGMISTYFFPFISKATDITAGITLVVTLAAAAIFWFMSSIPPHPILRMLKFRFYKVESANGMVYTLISKKELLDPKEISRVRKISSSMLMEAA